MIDVPAGDSAFDQGPGGTRRIAAADFFNGFLDTALADDELLEVTPANYRIRKRILGTRDRGKFVNRARDAAGAAEGR